MKQTTQIINELITEILSNLSPRQKPNISTLARTYKIPYQRLLTRYKGQQILKERDSST
jgi:hypothetical protein